MLAHVQLALRCNVWARAWMPRATPGSVDASSLSRRETGPHCCCLSNPPSPVRPALQVRFCAALGLAHEVKLQPQPIMGAEPDIISPGIVSPAHTDEPGEAVAAGCRRGPFSLKRGLFA